MILIVDDSKHACNQLGLFLKTGGYSNLLFAESGDEALKQLNMIDSEKSDEGIDLILMDIEMPEIDGIEACHRIKLDQRFQDIPVIMVTAKLDSENLLKAFDAGALDYITKPVNEVDLRTRVRSALKLKYETDTRKAHAEELYEKNKELNKALNEIKTLRGIIHICAHCKKICVDKGCWQQLESYIEDHTYAQFSHCVCEECKKKHPPV